MTLIFSEIDIHYFFERFIMFSEFMKTFLNLIIIVLRVLKTTSFLYIIILFKRLCSNLKLMIMIIIMFIIIISNRSKIRYSHVINFIIL